MTRGCGRHRQIVADTRTTIRQLSEDLNKSRRVRKDSCLTLIYISSCASQPWPALRLLDLLLGLLGLLGSVPRLIGIFPKPSQPSNLPAFQPSGLISIFLASFGILKLVRSGALPPLFQAAKHSFLALWRWRAKWLRRLTAFSHCTNKLMIIALPCHLSFP